MKSEFERGVQRAICYFSDLIDWVRIPVCELKTRMERLYGKPAMLSVPIYDSRTKKWISDSKQWCNPERSYREAISMLDRLNSS